MSLARIPAITALAVAFLTAFQHPGASALPNVVDPLLPTFDLPLEWQGRSAESSAAVVRSTTLAGGVRAALALPLDANQPLFDRSQGERAWASWPHYGWRGHCHSAYAFESRHVRATFQFPPLDLPVSQDTAGALGAIVQEARLYSPVYVKERLFDGAVLPVNDNAYVFLNGKLVGTRGTSYGVSELRSAIESEGWVADGRLGPEFAAALKLGENQLDLVLEEWCQRGGFARVNLTLAIALPER